jgi:septum formation protein
MSPRRRQLLGLLPYAYSIVVPVVDEDLHLDKDPAEYARRTARQKAEAVAGSLGRQKSEPGIIIAADTTVALGPTIMTKPGDANEAREMLTALRARTHFVHTGLCILDPNSGQEIDSVQTSLVTMRDYSPAEIEAYVASGDPFDKAGGYAIQDSVFRPVSRLEGCYLGVMGLSVCDLIRQLGALDVPVQFDREALEAAHQGFRCPVLNPIHAINSR